MNTINCGIPQGSALGTILFLIFINGLPTNTVTGVNQDLKNIYSWLCANKLSINVNKTKAILFHSKNKHINSLNQKLVINNNVIQLVK